MGTFTFKVKVLNQKSVAITGKEYTISLTYDHANCKNFVRTFSTNTLSAYTVTTMNKWNSATSTTPLIVNLPAITALTSTATDKMCKYSWAWTSTTTSTTNLKTAYTTTKFNVSGFQTSKTAYGSHTIVHKATSLAGNVVLTWTMNVSASDGTNCETKTKYGLATPTGLKYTLGATAISQVLPLPTYVGATAACVEYLTITIPTALNTFASIDTTNKQKVVFK